MFAMQVLRRRDEDGIERTILQEAAIVQIGLRLRCNRRAFLQALGVHIGKPAEFSVRALQREVDDFLATRPIPDDPEANPVVGAQQAGGLKRGRGRAKKEAPAIVHRMFLTIPTHAVVGGNLSQNSASQLRRELRVTKRSREKLWAAVFRWR